MKYKVDFVKGEHLIICIISNSPSHYPCKSALSSQNFLFEFSKNLLVRSEFLSGDLLPVQRNISMTASTSVCSCFPFAIPPEIFDKCSMCDRPEVLKKIFHQFFLSFYWCASDAQNGLQHSSLISIPSLFDSIPFLSLRSVCFWTLFMRIPMMIFIPLYNLLQASSEFLLFSSS